MRVYISASWRRRTGADRLRRDLQALGIEVCSSWTWRDETHEDARQIVERDISDLFEADTLVLLLGDNLSTGGKWFETGMAKALNYHIITIGTRDEQESIFALAADETYGSSAAFLEAIAKVAA